MAGPNSAENAAAELAALYGDRSHTLMDLVDALVAGAVDIVMTKDPDARMESPAVKKLVRHLKWQLKKAAEQRLHAAVQQVANTIVAADHGPTFAEAAPTAPPARDFAGTVARSATNHALHVASAAGHLDMMPGPLAASREVMFITTAFVTLAAFVALRR